MRMLWVGVMMCGWSLMLSACDKASEREQAKERRGRVAVADLERVVKVAGWATEAQQIMGSVEQDLSVKLGGLREHLSGILQEEYRKAGENPSAEVKNQLAVLERSMNEQFVGVMNRTQEELKKVRGSVVLQYREAIRPAVRKAASDLGYSVVLNQAETPGLYWTEVGVDITDQVIEQLLKDKPKVDIVLPAITLPMQIQPATQPAMGTNTNAKEGK